MRWLAFSAAILAGCGTPADDGAPLLVFTDWIRVESACAGYSFRAPPELTAVDVATDDGCHERWASSDCEYSSDYGSSASELGEYGGALRHERLQERVSGRDAVLVSAELADTPLRYLAALTIAELDPTMSESRLTLQARCRSSAAQLDALSVLRTLVLLE